jgi:hypothetical protein
MHDRIGNIGQPVGIEEAARRMGLMLNPSKPDLRKSVEDLLRHHGGHEVIKTVLALLKAEAKAADAQQAKAKEALDLATQAAAESLT